MSMLSMLISMGFKNAISIDKDPKKLEIAKKIELNFVLIVIKIIKKGSVNYSIKILIFVLKQGAVLKRFKKVLT